jgi:hypothetical protein
MREENEQKELDDDFERQKPDHAIDP